MDFPLDESLAGDKGTGTATDDFWAFNPQQPSPMTTGTQGDDTSLDDLLALYQTAQDAPPGAPFAPLGEPDSYAGFDFGGPGSFGDPATDQPFPGLGGAGEFDAFGGAGGFGAENTGQMDQGVDFSGGFDSFGAEGAFPMMGDAPPADFVAPLEADLPAFDLPTAPFEVAPAGATFDFDPASFDAAVDNAFAWDGPSMVVETPSSGAPPVTPREAPGGLADEMPFDFSALGSEDDDPFAMPGGPVFEAFNEPVAAVNMSGFSPAAPDDGGFPPMALDDLGGADIDFGIAEASPGPALDGRGPAIGEELPEFGEPSEFGEFADFGADVGALPAIAPLESVPADIFGMEDEDPFAMPGGQVFEAFDEPASATNDGVLAASPFEDFLATVEEAPAPYVPEEAPVETAPAGTGTGNEPASMPFGFDIGESSGFSPFDSPPVNDVVVEAPTYGATAQSAGGPALDLVALAALTGREVAIKSPDERRMANQQISSVADAIAGALDEVQGKLSTLYGDLQRAAVRRAPVMEIVQIAEELNRTRGQVGEGSEIYKQALYLRQSADAYLQMLKEL